MKKKLFLLLPMVLTLMAGCTVVQPRELLTRNVKEIEPLLSSSPWWRTAVFYEIFVRSFYDSNDDGIGDFNGITEKLDYLNDGNPETNTDLGITAIWLMPIHPSPSYHGYDVLNYYGVNPEYGSLADFKHFLEEAHKRGIKVIIDLVLNHTSNQHPFFKDASSMEGSAYHDWYVWSPENEGNRWHSAGVGPTSNYYYGYFCDCMPDLNFKNPKVTEQMEKVTEYWLSEIGVDGFRIDAAKHLIEEGDKLDNTKATHDWFKQFYTFYKEVNPNAFVVGEVSASDARVAATYAGDQMDMVFNFELASGFVNSANGGSVSGIGSAVTFIEKDNPDWTFGTFLTNHDQNRVMSVVGGNIDKAKVAATFLLTSPGTPFIYYGEEIGMEGTKPDEDIRKPMQWSDNSHAGFTTTTPWRELGENYMAANVQAELADPDSLLNYYKELIRLRTQYPVLSIGGYTHVSVSNRGIYAALRKSKKESILVLVNMTKEIIDEYRLNWNASTLKEGEYKLEMLMGESVPSDLKVSNFGSADYVPLVQLAPYTTYIFKIIPRDK
ncbi:MAG: alpha amylase catalytic subunit [Chloroflexi bacterium]|nr:MAG: alpha amylase catalytic subunit [Chloroflexota bacterium]